MQKKTKNIIGLMLVFLLLTGVFSASFVSAAATDHLIYMTGEHVSLADRLHPALITYNEELVVNNTGRFDSIYVGRQGVGGTTFFNGTIVNLTTSKGIDNPVTFGDDVRIDGKIFRLEEGGDKPLKIADTLMPATDKEYSLGTSDYKWEDGYFSGDIEVENITNKKAIISNSVEAKKITDGVASLENGNLDNIVTINGIPWRPRSAKASFFDGPVAASGTEEVFDQFKFVTGRDLLKIDAYATVVPSSKFDIQIYNLSDNDIVAEATINSGSNYGFWEGQIYLSDEDFYQIRVKEKSTKTAQDVNITLQFVH